MSSLRPAARRSRRWRSSRPSTPVEDSATTASPTGDTTALEDLLQLGDVLVAPSREVQQHGPAGQRILFAHDPGERVGGLEGGDDALAAGQQLEGIEHL